MWDEEGQDWNDWYIESDTIYYDDVDEYCKSDNCADSERLLKDREEIFKQIDTKKITNMTS